jgi:hypothetical protein
MLFRMKPLLIVARWPCTAAWIGGTPATPRRGTMPV